LGGVEVRRIAELLVQLDLEQLRVRPLVLAG
jgi:hypothetical protein